MVWGCKLNLNIEQDNRIPTPVEGTTSSPGEGRFIEDADDVLAALLALTPGGGRRNRKTDCSKLIERKRK